MRQVAYMALRALGRLVEFKPLDVAIASLERFFAAVRGKGGGSGWDSKGQMKALIRHTRCHNAMTIFDVGANNGSWSLELARHLPGDHRFFLFECVPYCYPGIECRSHGIPNMTLVRSAVSDSIGTTKMYVPNVGSGLASVHQRHDTSVKSHQYSEVVVNTTTIDAICAEYNIEFVDILKIDTEGHDFFVLKGASLLLQSGKIGTIQFEFGSANLNSRIFFNDFWTYLAGHGYSFFRILPGGGTLRLDHYLDEDEYFRGCSNIIAKKSA